MSDESEIGPDLIQDLIDEIAVDPMEGDRDWNVQIWIPEYAEPVLGTEVFESLEARLRSLPGIENLAWEDREVFLAKVSRGTTPEQLHAAVTEVVKAAVTDAGHELP